MNKKLISIPIIFGFLATPLMVLAQATTPVITPSAWIMGIINRLLGMVVWPVFVGATIIMLIYAGFTFVTAHGDPGKIKSAREAVIWVIIGIIVVIFAYSAIAFVTRIIAPGLPSGSPCTIGAVPEQCATGVCTGLCP